MMLWVANKNNFRIPSITSFGTIVEKIDKKYQNILNTSQTR